MTVDRSRSRHKAATWLIAAVLSGVPACTLMQPVPHEVARPPAPARKKQVQVDGDGMILGKPDVARISAGELLNRTNQLQAAGKPLAAQRWIECHPDVALDALRAAGNSQAQNPLVQEVARVYDRQCVRADEGWAALLRDRTAHPDRYAAYDKAREAMVGHLESRNYEEAARIRLTRSLPRNPPQLLALDAYHLLGATLLLNGQTDDALAALLQAAEKARDYPHQSAYVLLLVTEARRRLGQASEADQAWQAAVHKAGQLLTQDHAVPDPTLWERTAHFRMLDAPWPAEAQQYVRAFDSRFNGPMEEAAEITQASHSEGLIPGSGGEALVWACIGRCYLERRQGHAALTAFKRAEALTLDSTGKDRLQLAQAEAFAQMQQPVAAMAVLVNLVGRKDPEIACPALAMVAAFKLQDGSVQQGLTFLRQAIEDRPTVEWPGRGEAEANLGLAYLMSGDETNGLKWLHAAQSRFEANGYLAHLRQSLDNEAAYLEKAGRKKDARPLRERIRLLEQGQGRSANR